MRFESREALERQMDSARQLRAETLGDARWAIGALAGASAVVRRGLALIRTPVRIRHADDQHRAVPAWRR